MKSVEEITGEIWAELVKASVEDKKNEEVRGRNGVTEDDVRDSYEIEGHIRGLADALWIITGESPDQIKARARDEAFQVWFAGRK